MCNSADAIERAFNTKLSDSFRKAVLKSTLKDWDDIYRKTRNPKWYPGILEVIRYFLQREGNLNLIARLHDKETDWEQFCRGTFYFFTAPDKKMVELRRLYKKRFNVLKRRKKT